ncbi:putative glycosyltransferase YkoT [Aquisphaera giovannonii]|uniref:Putative glycosyltransferase YkoT n=1 Tax=Aquisphaera giovannonii TaxID=406548 RepID=A0A5B9WBL1_9BACT|nr:glycosyltransferase [Aquisphaera giovannonii]QEH37996.1 putative glycosyltransferase YkoT [Aquisphaera giovannonii]
MTRTDAARAADLVVLIPIYNDWASFRLLVGRLDEALMRRPHSETCRVIAVDDGSTEPPPSPFELPALRRIEAVEVLRLRLNLGHQRAIAVGLCQVEARCPCRAVVLMDGDGEDSPDDVPRLLDRCEAAGGRKIVFAERVKRSESLLFRAGYLAYRLLHRALTGIPVRVGNFSVIPAPLLSSLVVSSDLWNHYAASVVKARLPHDLLPTPRAKRLVGQSRMDLVALVTHGLSAMSVFGDRVGVRLILVLGLLTALAVVALAATVTIRLSTSLAIPGWATTASGLLVVFLSQLILLMTVFVFVALGGREGSSFLPARDYAYYIAGIDRIFPQHE